MRPSHLRILTSLLVLTTVVGVAAEPQKARIGAWGVDLAGADKAIKPGNDFYKFANGAWERGIRVGNARTGELMYHIPDPQPDCSGTCTAEGVVADRNGVIYGAEVGPAPGRLQRYARQ